MHVACMGRVEAYTERRWGILRESCYLGNPGADGKIIHELGIGCIAWIDLVQNRDRCLALVMCGNEPSGSIKCGELLD